MITSFTVRVSALVSVAGAIVGTAVAGALVALVVAGAGTVLGPTRVVRQLRGRGLPVLSEYVRLARSLGYAYVWEHWPDSGPDGAPHPDPVGAPSPVGGR